VAAALLAWAAAIRLLFDLGGLGLGLRLALYDLPLALGGLLAVAVAWTYWGWLIHER